MNYGILLDELFLLLFIPYAIHDYDTIRYDTIEEINVDSKAEYIQLNLAHVARN